MKNVLIFQLARLGDILQSTPLIQNLKLKKYKVYFLIDEKNKLLCNDIPGIDEIISFPIGKYLSYFKKDRLKECYQDIKKFIEQINRINFELIINLNHSEINFYLSQLINVKEKKGFKVEKNRFIEFLYSIIATSRKLNPFNLVDVFNHFIENPKIFEISISKNFTKIKNIPEKFIIIHLGAGHHLRVLNLDIMAKFVKEFLNEYKEFFIVLTGVKSEEKYGKKFLELIPNKKILNFIGKTDYFELKYLLKKSQLLISTDTGIMHMASAIGTKIIAIFFTSAFPFETGPYTTNALIISPNIDCYPCQEFRYCQDFFCKNLINEKIILKCCKFLLNNDSFKNKNKSISIYKPYFDNWGYFLKEIFGNNDKLYKKRLEIRENGKEISKKY